MANIKMKKKSSFNDIYIVEDDAREILEIVEAHEEVNQDTGEIVWRKPSLKLRGPKGGEFNLSIPEWAMERIQNMDIVPGDYFSGGWVGGKFMDAQFYEPAEDDEDDEQ